MHRAGDCQIWVKPPVMRADRDEFWQLVSGYSVSVFGAAAAAQPTVDREWMATGGLGKAGRQPIRLPANTT
jgi:hypothetical protein